MTYNIEDYYLDIKAMEGLDRIRSEKILSLYEELLTDVSMSKYGSKARVSLFKTLLNSGYLKHYLEEERDKKIKSIQE